MAWIIALIIWPSNLGVDTPAAVVTRVYSSDRHLATAQYLLVEGIAGFSTVRSSKGLRVELSDSE